MIDNQIIRDLARLAEHEARFVHKHKHLAGERSPAPGRSPVLAIRVHIATILRAMATVLEPKSAAGDLGTALTCRCE